jgi:hypothetical protein
MIPNSVRVPTSFGYVFPAGAVLLGVEAATDFDRRGEADDQVRDPQTGHRVWVVPVIDQDPEATKFGRSAEVKVKVIAPVAPVIPAAQYPGMRPLVEFEGMTLTPYVDSRKCRAPGRCGARMAYSVRATGLIAARLFGPDDGPPVQQ